MGQTVIGVNDPKAVKKFSAFLAVDVARTSYFSKKFTGKGAETSMPIQQLKELEKDAGDYISFDLSMQMTMAPVEDDDVLENKEQRLEFFTDGVYISQMRGGINTGGRMTRKRTIHNLRKIARARQTEWWSRLFDELHFMYLSGSRGVNNDYIFPLSYTGFAGNSLVAPDAYHLQVAGNKTKATLTANDKMTLTEIDKAVATSDTMGGGTQGIPKIQPIMVDGEMRFVIVMHPWQEYDLRTNTTSGQWLDIQKAAAGQNGYNSKIFKGGMGMYNDVVLHKHQAVIRFSDYGAGSDIAAARALYMGRQAAVCAFGSPGDGFRFSWYEETRDNGNQVVITSNSIFGLKKVTFNGLDFGVIAIDTAAADPTV